MSQKFSMKNLDCDKVVVYQDRAEIRRIIKTTIHKGETEIIIENITSSIDFDSVRVEGVGNATVLDVICQRKSIELNKLDTDEKLKSLISEINNLESKKKQINLKLDRILKQENTLNDFANTLSKQSSSSNKENNSALLASKENVDNFISFIDVYSSKLESLNKIKFDTEKELIDLDEKIQVTKKNHDALSRPQNLNESIEITILVQTNQEKSDINLFVSYVVYNASWSPKYDIRVYGKEKTMTINYFGLITQTTGEDWNDTKICLSTAVPSIGGNVPILPTQTVRYEIPIYKLSKSKSSHIQSFQDEYTLKSCGLMDGGFDYDTKESIKEDKIKFKTTQVDKPAVGSAFTFLISSKATIPSDSKSHKVSIGILNLKPEFEYETVPKVSPHAYIKAKVINTSEYALLAGPANIFLDNNFIAKTDLNSYSPLEEFECSLGVDPAIRIDYKPIRKLKSKSGLLSKTKTITYLQVIEIKNTCLTNAKILLTDNLPLSENEKIQVKLIEPDIKNKTNNIRLNKSNNLEFDLNIENGKTEEINIKYSIEYPANKEIEFC